MKNKTQKPGRLKSAVMNWLGFSLTDVAQWRQYYNQESDSGAAVSDENAMKLAAVWGCVRILSETIAGFPLHFYDKTGGDRVEIDNDLSDMLRYKPNPETTPHLFWQSLIANAVLTGNGFGRKRRMLSGRIVGVDVIPTSRMNWGKNPDGTYWYRYIRDDGKSEPLPREDIFHLPGFTLGDKFGMSVISYGVNVIGSGISANKAANATFKSGLMKTVAFKLQNFLKPDQRTEFRQNFEKNIAGALNAGKSPLLEGGMEASEIGINPRDAQLLESRNYSAGEICTWFNVPGRLIGVKDEASAWASSSEQLNIWFLQYGLMPWLIKIEQMIKKDLMTNDERRKIDLEFNFDGLMRATSEKRANFYQSALNNGWMNINEVRQKENMKKVDGGDVHMRQLNLTPVDGSGDNPGQPEGALSAAKQRWGIGDEA